MPFTKYGEGLFLLNFYSIIWVRDLYKISFSISEFWNYKEEIVLKNIKKIILIFLALSIFGCKEYEEDLNLLVYVNPTGFNIFSWSTGDGYYHSKYCEDLEDNYDTMTLGNARKEGLADCPNCNIYSDTEFNH